MACSRDARLRIAADAAMTMRRNERQNGARRALEDLTALPAVLVRLEGTEIAVAFDPDMGEHERRSAAGTGAVTSRSLLHALWLLPARVPVPAAAIPERKRQHLRTAGHFTQEDGGYLERVYSPAGTVRAIAIASPDIERSVEQAIRFTPIVQRVVVVDFATRPSSGTLALAADWGVGVVRAQEAGCDVLLHPAPAVVGIPAVYRWWLAELAYEGWLQQSAQPVS